MSGELHMLRCDLKRSALVALARRRGIPVRDADIGYLAHVAVRSVFGDMAPQPFATFDRGRFESLLGYTTNPAEDLLRHAQSFADPADFAVMDSSSVATKPLPYEWPANHRMGFEIRVCPVVRKSGQGLKHRAGAEVDAFLARCWDSPEGFPVDREAVYVEWLTQRIEAQNGARVVSAQMTRFQRGIVLRSDHGDNRKMVRCERPDAVLQGVLEVVDSSLFKALLARGIGRHRAFGFGMILLRRP